jgi:nitroreductase
MDLLKVIHERRSVRRYRGDPVPDEIIIEILRAARRAPSWHNTQVPRFIVVKNPDVKKALSDTLTPANPARRAVERAPCVICVIARKRLSGYSKGEPVTEKGDWLMFDAGIAMEHIVLTSWNFGLGTVYVGAFDAAAAGEILKVPDDFSLVAMTPLGYFEETPRATPRRPLGESVFLDEYGLPYMG